MSEESELSLRLHDARQALKEIEAGNASGFKPSLYGRAIVESTFDYLGRLITLWPPTVALFTYIGVVLVCALLCIGFVNSDLETNIDELWVETGGRLDNEIEYTDDHLNEDFVSSQEIVIQLVNSDNFSASLYDHLQIIKAATEINITYDNRTFQFRDLCIIGRLIVPVPELQRVALQLAPCLLITPIDCYWEGSILQEPDGPVPPVNTSGCRGLQDQTLTWGNVNFTLLRECLLNSPESGYTTFLDKSIEGAEVFGYIDKPCFSPRECGPNITLVNPAEVQEELRDGCIAFSGLVVEPSALLYDGNAFENNVPGAVPVALRTVIGLNGPATIQEDLAFYKKIDLSLSQVEELLFTWKDRFFDLVISYNSGREVYVGSGKTWRKSTNDQFFGWTSDTVDDVAARYSGISPALVIIGYILMIVYCGITFLYFDWVNSHVSVGLMGLLLVAIASAAALGLTAAAGVSFNLTTTQIFPFLVLGIGVDDMFVIGDAFFEIEHHLGRDVGIVKLLTTTLRVVGPSVTLTSITNAAGFFLSAVIPIPVIRNFAIQVGCAVVFNYFALLIGLSSFLVLDYYRVKTRMVDVFCFIPGSICYHIWGDKETAEISNKDGKLKEVDAKEESKFSGIMHRFKRYKSPLTALVVDFYSPFLQNYIVKAFVVTIFSIWLGFCVWGCTKVEDGLNLDDALPSGTVEHSFASANVRHFAAYSFFVVTKNIDYSDREVQRALLQMSEEVGNATYVEPAGRLNSYWLRVMIDFFKNIYGFYRQVYCIQLNMTSSNNQTAQLQFQFRDLLGTISLIHKAINSSLNSTLLVRVLVPSCDPSLPPLVIREGNDFYIPSDKFYKYIPLWSTIDSLNYQLVAPRFNPRPPTGNLSTLFIPNNMLSRDIANYGPLLYARQTFFSEGLSETSDFESFINEIRKILESYGGFGINSYPSGVPFLYWEQYINLRRNVGLACGLILVACFVATTFFLMDLWSAIILVCMLAIISTEVFGVTGFLEIRFSSVPAIIIIASVGVAVEFTAPLTFYFLKASPEPGKKKLSFFGIFDLPSFLAHWFVTRNERMHKALQHRFTPVFNGSITTFLGIIMLVFAELPFVRLYFFGILLSIVVLGMLNGLVFLPVLLSLIGPPAQAYPKEKDEMNGIPLEAKNQNFQ